MWEKMRATTTHAFPLRVFVRYRCPERMRESWILKFEVTKKPQLESVPVEIRLCDDLNEKAARLTETRLCLTNVYSNNIQDAVI